jgi:hypothetical protein
LVRTCVDDVFPNYPNAKVYTNEQNLGPNQLYARTKLAVLLFVKYGLVERVIVPNNDRIWAAATHPGAVSGSPAVHRYLRGFLIRSSFWQVHTGQQDQFKEAYGETFGTVMKHVVIPFMRNPEQGTLSTLYAATSEDVEKNHW